MHRDLCGGRPSLCDAMKPTKGADLLKYLRKVEFQGESALQIAVGKRKTQKSTSNCLNISKVLLSF